MCGVGKCQQEVFQSCKLTLQTHPKQMFKFTNTTYYKYVHSTCTYTHTSHDILCKWGSTVECIHVQYVQHVYTVYVRILCRYAPTLNRAMVLVGLYCSAFI